VLSSVLQKLVPKSQTAMATMLDVLPNKRIFLLH